MSIVQSADFIVTQLKRFFNQIKIYVGDDQSVILEGKLQTDASNPLYHHYLRMASGKARLKIIGNIDPSQKIIFKNFSINMNYVDEDSDLYFAHWLVTRFDDNVIFDNCIKIAQKPGVIFNSFPQNDGAFTKAELDLAIKNLLLYESQFGRSSLELSDLY